MNISEPIQIIVNGGTDFPKILMHNVKQTFSSSKIDNIYDKISLEMNNEKIRPKVKKGMRVAVCVGSRGISNLPEVVKSVIDILKQWGALPFIVPAMGSHGGATGNGQKQVLHDLGITEEKMYVDICSAMEVVSLGRTADGLEVFLDKAAYQADLIVPINRIKPHTEFKGPIESGIMKMLTIGLGNHIGASYYHRQGFNVFKKIIPEIGQYIIDKAPIGFSIAIIENSYKDLAEIHVVPAQETATIEPILQKKAKELMPRIEVDEIDVLIVERIGKNISGPGMDSNITGRASAGVNQGFNTPDIKRVVILDLTEETHGNGIGIGFADTMPMRILKKLDFSSTYANAITAGEPGQAKMPIITNTDLEAFAVALKTCPGIEYDKARIVRIKDTSSLTEIQVSTALLDQVKRRNNCEIEINGQPLTFDRNGKICPYKSCERG